MNVDLSIVIAILGAAISVATFFIGRFTNKKNEGKEQGTVLSEIGYIKSGVDDIKRKQEKQDAQHIDVITRITTVETSVKHAHERIDHLESKI